MIFKKLSLKKSFLFLNFSLIFLYFILSFSQNSENNSKLKSKQNSNNFKQKLISIEQNLKNCSQSPAPLNSSLIHCDSALSLLSPPLIGPQLDCEDLNLLVFVFNRVNDVTRRHTIRNTWKRPLEALNKIKAKVVFAIARSRDPHVEARVGEEARAHKDIIQFDFFEAYFNCSLKAISLIKFCACKCPNLDFALKVDDDVFIDAHALQSALYGKDRNSFHGFVWRAPKVQRNSEQKWKITEKDYSSATYPDYIGGPYLIPGKLTQSLYEMALQSLPWLPFEDVLVTGVLAQRLGIARKHMKEVLYAHLLGDTCDLSRLDLCFYTESAIWWQNLNNEEIHALYRLKSELNLNECQKWSFHALWAKTKMAFSASACIQL